MNSSTIIDQQSNCWIYWSTKSLKKTKIIRCNLNWKNKQTNRTTENRGSLNFNQIFIPIWLEITVTTNRIIQWETQYFLAIVNIYNESLWGSNIQNQKFEFIKSNRQCYFIGTSRILKIKGFNIPSLMPNRSVGRKYMTPCRFLFHF